MTTLPTAAAPEAQAVAASPADPAGAPSGPQRLPQRLRAVIGTGLRDMRGSMALAALALCGVVLAELAAPWPLKIIFDQLLLDKPLPASMALLQPLLALGDWPALMVLAGAIALIALLGGTFSYLQIYTTARVGNTMAYRLRSALFAHLQQLSLAFHHRTRTGELLTKVASDTNLLRDAFADWALTFSAHVVTMVAMLVIMFLMNWRLALVVSISLPPLLLVISMLNRRVKSSVREQRRHEGRMASRLNEVLSSMAMIQAFGRREYEEDRFRHEIQGNLEAGMRSARNTAAITKSIAIISAVGTAVTVLVGAKFVMDGQLTPGELLIFVAYVTGLYKPVRDLGKLSAKFSRASVSLNRIAEIFSAEPESVDPPDALELATPQGEIRFENVTFGYDPRRPVLDGVSFTIKAGERVALVGPSGAGKSTLMSLLMRLYEPSGGRILLDGVDIRRLKRDSLRRQIGIVLQENVLFAVTVRENIAYGKPEADQEEIEQAATLARAHEFIVDLADGYDTELGDRGATLSGGQRQRLCLARALLKKPSILIMDEPTASIDAASARLIHESVAHFHRHKTLVVIAHDYADMASFDRILVLKDGRLVESGRHEALVAQRGTYLALVERRHA
jgi:ATP-binding cassette subfamily B protein/subfamily B ATP-binding cassette protein MsbA